MNNLQTYDDFINESTLVINQKMENELKSYLSNPDVISYLRSIKTQPENFGGLIKDNIEKIISKFNNKIKFYLYSGIDALGAVSVFDYPDIDLVINPVNINSSYSHLNDIEYVNFIVSTISHEYIHIQQYMKTKLKQNNIPILKNKNIGFSKSDISNIDNLYIPHNINGDSYVDVFFDYYNDMVELQAFSKNIADNIKLLYDDNSINIIKKYGLFIPDKYTSKSVSNLIKIFNQSKTKKVKKIYNKLVNMVIDHLNKK